MLKRLSTKKKRKILSASEMGRLGGHTGGLIAAALLTPEQRKARACAAAKARWDKYRASKGKI